MSDSILVVWALATLLMAVTTLAAVVTSFYLYEWRRQFLANPLAIVPEDLSENLAGIQLAVSKLAKRIGDASDSSAEGTLLLTKMEEVQSTYLSLQRNLDRRDEEVTRLRSGHDRHVFRGFLRRFIRVDRALREEIRAQDRNWDGVGAIVDLLADAFDECDLERFEPGVGAGYRESFGVADRPQYQPTDDAGLDGTIADVIDAGYRLRTEDGGFEILEQARVTVYVTKGV